MSHINNLLAPFNLQAEKVEKLEGYISTNFKVTDENGHHYVVKHYSDKSELPLIKEEIEFVNTIKSKLPFQLSETLNVEGKNIHSLADGSYVRLLTYIEGQFLAESPQSPSLLYNFGASTAQLNIALKDINAPHISSNLSSI